jgi:hypothetical protein
MRLPKGAAEHCSQAYVENRKLTIVMDTAAWAERARGLGTELKQAAHQAGSPANTYRVKVMPFRDDLVEAAIQPKIAGGHEKTLPSDQASNRTFEHVDTTAQRRLKLRQKLARLHKTIAGAKR